MSLVKDEPTGSREELNMKYRESKPFSSGTEYEVFELWQGDCLGEVGR